MPAEPPPSDNLYIWRLPFEFSDDECRSIFGVYGTVVSTKVMQAKNSSAALVRFSSVKEATWVRQNLAGVVPEGLLVPIEVNFAESREDRSRRAPTSGAKPDKHRSSPYVNATSATPTHRPHTGDREEGTLTAQAIVDGLHASGCMPGGTGYTNNDGALFVTGMPPDTTDLHLYKIFSPFGSIAPNGVLAATTPEGVCKGYGFINFLDSGAAQEAISILDGTELPGGRNLRVSIKTPKGGAS